MNVLPIQITDKGILIPREYLPGVDEVETVVTAEHIWVRSKTDSETEFLPSESSRFSFVGIAKSSNPNTSEEMND